MPRLEGSFPGRTEARSAGTFLRDTSAMRIYFAGPLFTAAERQAFLLQATEKLPNVEIDVFDTLLVDFARKHGARALVKGLRAISDFEYEFEMNQLNRKLAPDIESVYLMASPEYSFLSSSGVRELATFGADIKDLVPNGVAQALHDRLSRDSG